MEPLAAVAVVAHQAPEPLAATEAPAAHVAAAAGGRHSGTDGTPDTGGQGILVLTYTPAGGGSVVIPDDMLTFRVAA